MPTSFPMPNPWSDNVLVNAAALYANTTVPINDVAATSAVTTPITTGITATGSASAVSGIYLMTIGPVVYIKVSFTIGTAITVPASGDVTNTNLGQITSSTFWPSQAWVVQCGGSGSLTGFSVTTAGVIQIVATTPGTSLGIGAATTLCGNYPL